MHAKRLCPASPPLFTNGHCAYPGVAWYHGTSHKTDPEAQQQNEIRRLCSWQQQQALQDDSLIGNFYATNLFERYLLTDLDANDRDLCSA